MRSTKPPSPKEKISVIHSSEIEDYLSNLQNAKVIAPTGLICACCGSPITTTNFGAIARIGGKITLSCNKESCLLGLTAKEPGSEVCK